MREWQSSLAQICRDRWALGLLPSCQQVQVELSPSSVLLLLQCLEAHGFHFLFGVFCFH